MFGYRPIIFIDSHYIYLTGFLVSEIFYLLWLRGFYYVCKQMH